MPRQMTNLGIHEVSAVDHPAHLVEGWLTMKSASPEVANLLLRAEAIAKGIDPSTLTQGSTMPDPIPEDVRKALDPAVLTYLESLEKANKDAEDAAVAKAAADAAANSPTSTANLSEAEAFEKALSELPEPVRKAIIATQREAAESKAVAKSLQDAADLAAFTAVAKSLDVLPGVKADEFGEVLRKAAGGKLDNPAFAPVLDVLAKANSSLKESGAFSEAGSGAQGGANSGQAALEALAKALVDASSTSDAPLTFAQAIAKAATDNPDLYIQHRGEMNRANSGAV